MPTPITRPRSLSHDAKMEDVDMDTDGAKLLSTTNGQHPLPSPPDRNDHKDLTQTSHNHNSPHTHSSDDTGTPRGSDGDSQADDAGDVTEGEGEGEGDGEGDGDGDGDGEAGDDKTKAKGNSKQKKKPNRFPCVGFGPCNLSFTRSEHLARHIRKHTGERPYECHCKRRFSRLDNLRQHAQTVHASEQIPEGSLAATGTRFQRQVRTERVIRSPTGNRSRSNTNGSITGPIRGHSKSFSTSNIGHEIGPLPNHYGMYRQHEDIRRRPPPLAIDPHRPPPPHEPNGYRPSTGHDYRPITPTEFRTPTSATFTNGPGSPGWEHHIVSPSPSHSRPHSMYSLTNGTNGTNGLSPDGRRLSIASAETAGFFPARVAPANGAYIHPQADGRVDVSSAEAAARNGWPRRRDSFSEAADESLRRQTWHNGPRDANGIGRPVPIVTSSSANNINGGNPEAHYARTTAQLPLPPPDSPVRGNSVRLPGIDSLMNSGRITPPPRRGASPMAMDIDRPQQQQQGSLQFGANESALRAAMDHPADYRRRQSGQWDSVHLNNGISRLGLEASTPPNDSNPIAYGNQAPPPPVAHQTPSQPRIRFETEPHPRYALHSRDEYAPREDYARGHHHTMSAPALHMASPRARQRRRQGMYFNAGDTARAPLNGDNHHIARTEHMEHPNLVNGFQGFPARNELPETVHEHENERHGSYHQQVARGPPPASQQQYAWDRRMPDSRRGYDEGPHADSSRLDALVAVATGQVSKAVARPTGAEGAPF